MYYEWLHTQLSMAFGYTYILSVSTKKVMSPTEPLFIDKLYNLMEHEKTFYYLPGCYDSSFFEYDTWFQAITYFKKVLVELELLW